jgi:hypothetical protein
MIVDLLDLSIGPLVMTLGSELSCLTCYQGGHIIHKYPWTGNAVFVTNVGYTWNLGDASDRSDPQRSWFSPVTQFQSMIESPVV